MGTTIAAEPEAISVNLDRTAIVMIDMQRDFLEPGGFGETLGNDVSLLAKAIALAGRCSRALAVKGSWSSTRVRVIVPTCRTHLERSSNAARPVCASAPRVRWGAF